MYYNEERATKHKNELAAKEALDRERFKKLLGYFVKMVPHITCTSENGILLAFSDPTKSMEWHAFYYNDGSEEKFRFRRVKNPEK